MKNFKLFKVLCIIIAFSFIISLAACGTEKENDPKSTLSTIQGTQEDKTTVKEEAPDPFGKYEPTITIKAVRSIDPGAKLPEGQTMDDNDWKKAYESELGINLEYVWVADQNNYEQKINVSIASNDLPDVIQFNTSKQLDLLVKGDRLADLSESWTKFASPLLKEKLEMADQVTFGTQKYKGKLMAIPSAGAATDDCPVVTIRYDWLKKLNLPEPKNLDDLCKIAEAFVNNDPDGNGKKDTYGIAVSKDFDNYLENRGQSSLFGFFNGFHAYPQLWVKGADGKIGYGSIQPEVKNALKKLQELYKAGAIDKEFGVKDWSKSAEAVISGKAGIVFGQFWTPAWPWQDLYKKDKNAEVRSYPILSSDDQPAKAGAKIVIYSSFGVNKSCKNPEAAVKMANLYMKYYNGTPEEYSKYIVNNKAQTMPFKLAFIQTGPVNTQFEAATAIMNSLEENDNGTSITNSGIKDAFDAIGKFIAGDRTQFLNYGFYGKDGTVYKLMKYKQDGNLMVDEFFGPPTATMVEKKSTLDKMEYETFTKIIMGRPIEEFDTFVTKWKELGGDKITQEINDWAASR